jgi:hypothetical protein
VVDFDVPEHQVEGNHAFRRVCFDVEKGCFPVRYEEYFAKDTYLHQRIVAERVEKVVGADGANLFMGGHFVLEGWDPLGEGRLIHRLVGDTDLKSVKLNDDIPDDVFTISLSDVCIARDRDTGEAVQVNPLPPALQKGCKAPRSDGASFPAE